mgnify:CR=1 FL=1
MRVSVVVPAFNHPELLERSLATLEVQRHEASEIIVVDDGSAKPLEVPSWVTLYRFEPDGVHRGSSRAKNKGAEISTGDHLCFADSDILHMPDALVSLKRQMARWEDEGEPNALINVWRVSLPDGYPARRTRNIEALLKRMRAAGLAFDEDLERSSCYWEQNCGLLRRDLFDRVGRYDDVSLRSWGFNNHDLDMRVMMAGGRISSAVPRHSTGKRLLCFHIWHEATREREQADKEFAAKWGEKWTQGIMEYAKHRGECERKDRAV